MSQYKISQILVSTRTALGISLQVASEETRIPLQHLEALEKEDFDVFPNHALALGFLRSYVEFLDIDKEYISLLFQKTVDEGMRYKKNPSCKLENSHFREKPNKGQVSEHDSHGFFQKFVDFTEGRLFMGLVSLLCGGSLIIGTLFVYTWFKTDLRKKDYFYDWESLDIWQGSLKKGERIIIREREENLAEFYVNDICENSILLSMSDNPYLLQKGESCLVDFTGNAREDLILSYDGQVLSLKPIAPDELLVTTNTLLDRNLLFPKIPFSFSSLSEESLTSCIYASASQKPELTFLRLTLKEASLVRYLVDEGLVEESYLPSGSVLDLSFATSLLLWVANPKVVSVSIGAQMLDLWGDSVLGIGQLVWVQTPKSEFELRFLPL